MEDISFPLPNRPLVAALEWDVLSILHILLFSSIFGIQLRNAMHRIGCMARYPNRA